MEKIDERWPEGIQKFWSEFDKLKGLGEESGYDPEEGKLVICRCYNRQLDGNILKEKEHIKVLEIRKNELKEESYEIIAQLSSLRKLVLESVGSSIMELNVQNLEELTDVEIRSASNTELPEWILKIKNLESLNISNMRIEEFPDCDHYDGYKRWKKLDISYTAIENLPDFGNKKLDRLRELRVANTEIEKIPSCYFTEALRLLDCSNTRICSLRNFKDAVNLEVFRCTDNTYLKSLLDLPIDGLRVLDVSRCTKLESLPDQNYSKLEVLAVCGDFFDTLPLNLLEHCIEQTLSFKQERVKKLKDLNYDQDELSDIPKEMKGVYIDETFIRKMDLRYLLDNDYEFLRYYIEMERQEQTCAKHETKIMVLGDEDGVGDLFLRNLFPEYPQLFYVKYGGLKVLDTTGGELDYIQRKLDDDVDISIWTMENGIDEQFMHYILFNEHDFFVIVLREGDKINCHERAVYWLKEIERCVQYATIAFAVVSDNAKEAVILNLKEVRQECDRTYFRFLDNVYNININDIDEFGRVTDWLVEGIKEKSNYEMRILPEWKRLRGKITSYLDLRSIINQDRFDSLLTLTPGQGRKAFINYLLESKSLFHIPYSGEENYYFKTEWIISALFALLSLLRKGEMPAPFALDDLRDYLQIEKGDYLDFFQDSKSLGSLMKMLEGMGAVFRVDANYRDLLALPYLSVNSSVYNEMLDSSWMTYKISYSILTEQMAAKAVSVLLKQSESIKGSSAEIYKDCIALSGVLERTGRTQRSKGYIVIRIITGCPGKILFYGVTDSEMGRIQPSAEKTLRRCLSKFIYRFVGDQEFSLWQSEIFLDYTTNSISDFISMEMVEGYVRAGYGSVFMTQYNTLIDMDELYSEFVYKEKAGKNENKRN